MMVVYCLLLPLILTWYRYQRKGGADPSSGFYKPSFWWFETFDLFYRLSMTGMLLVIAPNSADVRMIASTFIAILCLAYVTMHRPFASEELNNVLATGQIIVTITVFSGFVVESHTNERESGEYQTREILFSSFLLIINLLVVAISVWQHWVEELSLLIDTIVAQEPFDVKAVGRLCEADAPLRAVVQASLQTALACLEKVRDCDDGADEHFEYFIKQLLVIHLEDGRLLWDDQRTAKMEWTVLLKSTIDADSSVRGELFISGRAYSDGVPSAGQENLCRPRW